MNTNDEADWQELEEQEARAAEAWQREAEVLNARLAPEEWGDPGVLALFLKVMAVPPGAGDDD